METIIPELSDFYLDLHQSLADQGLAGGEPGSPAIYVAMGHLLFDSVEEFQSAIGPHMEAIIALLSLFPTIGQMLQRITTPRYVSTRRCIY